MHRSDTLARNSSMPAALPSRRSSLPERSSRTSRTRGRGSRSTRQAVRSSASPWATHSSRRWVRKDLEKQAQYIASSRLVLPWPLGPTKRFSSGEKLTAPSARLRKWKVCSAAMCMVGGLYRRTVNR